MSIWMKIADREGPVSNEHLNIGACAYDKFLNAYDHYHGSPSKHKQEITHYVLYKLAKANSTDPLDFGRRVSPASYLMLATFKDGSKGIYCSHIPLKPIQLDALQLSNCWEKLNGISEVFCYDDNKTLLSRLLDLVDDQTFGDEMKNDINNYLKLESKAEANVSMVMRVS